jgi:NAD(P)H-dependent flavin oxidoreductase YrpB (nitropropane dioxygenase family)
MITTRLTERLGIEHPVVLGGMGSGTNVDLVVAVCEAGGLGILGATAYSPEQIREAAAEIRGRSRRPFGLNLLIAFTSEAQLEACIASGVPVLSTAWGEPGRHAARAKEAGIPWMHMVQRASDAAEAARLGATAVVAQGHEGGGHVGLVSTMPLVPVAVDAIAQAMTGVSGRPPVVAAGGIADGRGLAAALALGAEGVLLGTRFLATREAPIPQAAKEAICGASESDTICNTIPDLVSNPRWLEIGALARGLRPRAVMEWVGREEELARLPEPERRAMAERWATARNEGRIEDTSVLAGEDAGLIGEVLPAGEVVRRTVAEAEEILRRMGGFLLP